MNVCTHDGRTIELERRRVLLSGPLPMVIEPKDLEARHIVYLEYYQGRDAATGCTVLSLEPGGQVQFLTDQFMGGKRYEAIRYALHELMRKRAYDRRLWADAQPKETDPVKCAQQAIAEASRCACLDGEPCYLHLARHEQRKALAQAVLKALGMTNEVAWFTG